MTIPTDAFVSLLALAASWELACPVCFGAGQAIDSPMVQGMNNGILALLAFVALVQGGFAALFLSIRRRGRRLERSKRNLRVIRGGLG